MQIKIKYLAPVLLILFLVSFTGCKATTAIEKNAQQITENGDYNIGDTGPAGGFIFYVNPN